ncbi:hypothetical protein [Sulfitobacter sp.]|uniref:hypothetical protein n=1 Tax=Sulfitobacter sp. TaxID=1903071 RepID=UPI0030014FEA
MTGTPAPELAHLNRLLIARLEALRVELAARDAEIERLSRMLLAQDMPTNAPPASRGLSARLGLRR